METTKFRFDGSKKFDPHRFDTAGKSNDKDKEESVEKTAKNTLEIEALQDKLYADGSKGLLVIFQAMDAAGKDGTIKHVFSGVNPEGIVVSSFKQPSASELAHDYLWRLHNKIPPRGMIGIFNRSYYEDVLIARVLNLPQNQNLPKAALEDVWKKRYRQIRDFEQYLDENGITVVKFMLHVSKETQRQRFLDRLEDPAKNWKFSKSDLDTRERWDDYMKAYKECVNNTATPGAPWYVVPADYKWYTRLVVSEVVKDTLRDMRPAYPVVSDAQRQALEECRGLLEGEG